MESVFSPDVNALFIERINKLTPSTPALWGKMNAAQMLAHCQVPVKVAFGELNTKGGLIGLLFGGMAKKKLVNEQPFTHNLPTMKEAKILDKRDFEIEKAVLIECVKRFTAGPDVLTKKPHPFFGPLTVDEWNTLQYKHLDHHLRQFGV
ncbi:DUF1569 domain-containing protein [Mucilaginibacter sp.]|uniref:DUF1569 domain-containing protein n=1 Tax=Mucilaginibacter sp. TaxID=1882438 RepID=UPI00261EB6F2|nr:DUF1569 domain-containing protein [Mucilaginibacter sp.]MDB4920608.1 hypothetical protein [Mucilaginibacter sp.]